MGKGRKGEGGDWKGEGDGQKGGECGEIEVSDTPFGVE